MEFRDRDYVLQCLDSHPEAYRHLVKRYQGPLLSFLAGRLGNVERAEEAAQETFVRAYFSLDKLKQPEAFFSWLLGIGSRVAKAQQEEEFRRRELIRQLPQDPPSPEISTDGILENVIATLEEPYRQVILLRYYGQHSCEEVARQLNMPLGTVTKYLSRAYALLRQRLARIEGSEVRS